jgi:ferritin-like metal-binding protein YciE
VALANQLGHKDAAQLLEQTLNEEKETDQKLNQVALSVANPSASGGQGGGKQQSGGRSARAGA